MHNFDIQRIKDANPIRDVISEHLDLKRHGVQWKARCPFHPDTDPSFVVYPDNFFCWGCHAHGDVFDFLVLKLGLTWKEAAEHLAKRANIPTSESPLLPKHPPRRDKNGLLRHERRKGGPTPTQKAKTPEKANFRARPEPDTMHRDALADYLRRERLSENDFFRYLAGGGRGDAAATVATMYGLCTYTGGRALFVYVDTLGRIRTAKAMPYNPTTGKRIKKKDGGIYPDAEYIHPKEHLDGRAWNYVACFFGEHLLNRYPTLPVWIFESEKTAMVATVWQLLMFGELRAICLAVGGGGLSPSDLHKWRPLQSRFVQVWPDNALDGGPLQRWSEAADLLKKNGFSVVVNSDLQRRSTPEDQNAKIDFADVVARDWSRPDPDTPTSGPTPPSGGGGDGGGNVRPFDASGDGGTVRAAWETFNRLCSLNLEKVTECVRSGGYGRPEHAAARLCLDLVTAHVNGHLYWRHEYRAAYFAILALQRWAAVTAAA
jgi:hypothetical protein